MEKAPLMSPKPTPATVGTGHHQALSLPGPPQAPPSLLWCEKPPFPPAPCPALPGLAPGPTDRVPCSARHSPYAICWMEMGEQPSSLRATSPSMAFLWGESMLEPGTAWPPSKTWCSTRMEQTGWDLTLHQPTLLVTSPSRSCNTHHGKQPCDHPEPPDKSCM